MYESKHRAWPKEIHGSSFLWIPWENESVVKS